MNFGIFREICFLSIFCGLILSITPEGSVKRMTEIVCTVVLLYSCFSAFKETDLDAFRFDSAVLRETEMRLSENALEAQSRFNRLVIEEDYIAYILNKAQESGVEISELRLETQQESDGVWVPWSVTVRSVSDDNKISRMKSVIRDDLGIPYERQLWHR